MNIQYFIPVCSNCRFPPYVRTTDKLNKTILRGFHSLVKKTNTSFLTRTGQLITLCTANMPLALQSRGNLNRIRHSLFPNGANRVTMYFHHICDVYKEEQFERKRVTVYIASYLFTWVLKNLGNVKPVVPSTGKDNNSANYLFRSSCAI